MQLHLPRSLALTVTSLVLLVATPSAAEDWTRFRGPGGLGVSGEKGLPSRWSSEENIAWKTALPGPGASSPIILGDRVFVTCYTGYGLKPDAGDQKDLRRSVLCFDRDSGASVWQTHFEPQLPEHEYQGEGSYHGYAASTPISDGERLYVFFGKSGVYCFDLDGKELWHTKVGQGTHRWGSGASPILHGKLLIVNASVESDSIVALDTRTGEERWRADNIRQAWNTPMVVNGTRGQTELVVSTNNRLLALHPETGKRLWNTDGVHRYVCPSVVAHKDIVYSIGGGSTSLAVRLGGRGDVTRTHVVWREGKGSNVSSPVYHEGHLYWAKATGGVVMCKNAATGETVFEKRLMPSPRLIWSSPVLADGKLYFVAQREGTYVCAATPEFKQLAHNVFKDDDSRANASPAVSNGQLFLRNDRNLYCIGKKSSR